MTHPHLSIGTRERRLLGYRSNMERFWETTKSYDYKNPLGWVGAGTHLFTQGFGLDPLIKDAGRALDGNTSDLPAYDGIWARTRQNITETLGDIVRLKPFSAITKVINVPMDFVADNVDIVAQRFDSRSKVHHALAA